MSDIQVFMSYARFDDAAPPDDPAGPGFVTALRRQLEYEFTRIGLPRPKLWWDRERVDDGDYFPPKIEQAIDDSSLLLIVLSQNWMDRPYCQKELELFQKRWSAESDIEVQHRIKIVRIGHVDQAQHPKPLKDQVGYAFFKYEGSEERGNELLFFDRGKQIDSLYMTRVRKLGSHLWRTADSFRRKVLPPADDPPEDVQPLVAAPRNGRTVYLAKPARDMRRAYQSVWRELYQSGFDVVPASDEDIPFDGPGTDFVDSALSKAEISIHLLGNDPGYAPEQATDRIVALQLAQAAIKATATPAKDGAPGFHRIIWAPKILDNAGAVTAERDVNAVVRRFGRPLDSDEVEGGTFGRLVDFLRDHLMRVAPDVEIAPTENLAANAKVYLCHTKADTDYAIDIAAELQKLPTPIEPLMPAFKGDPAKRRELHRRYLQECDAVVMCWASAPDVWVKASSLELQGWRDTHRTGKLGFRGLIAGPPPGSDKKNLLRVPPRSQIDKILDLTQPSQPLPEALSAWFLGAAPNSP